MELPSGEWCGRNGDRRLSANFDTPEEAIVAMERMLDGEEFGTKEIQHGWQRTADGNYYMRTPDGAMSVKKAKSGKWYVRLNGKPVPGLNDRWFDSAQQAKEMIQDVRPEFA